MELVDTHCHIHEIVEKATPVYDKWHEKGFVDADELVREAAEAGVSKLICVGTTPEDSRLAIEFVKDRPGCWASIGIHPHEAQKYASNTEVLENFAKLADMPKMVAVGECGLDYFYRHSLKEDQIKILKFQIELALKHDLPVIFHVREAFDDFWPIFESYRGIRGVLHSFTDSKANLERAVGHGLYIGVNGIATFTKNPEQLAMYQAIPLENLLFETDSPFLTPIPYRGNINMPKYVRTITEFLSKIRGEDLKDLASLTTSNAQKLFGLE